MPDRIGRYRITRKLGEGGMGIVYEALDERLERPLAIKTLRGSLSEADTRERLLREARAAASVRHPAICQLYEVGEDAGALFLAMELLEGESLAERLTRGPLGARDAVALGLSLLDALQALHDRGLVHRDLKPSNIFLTRHGPKLLDFGLARPTTAGLPQDGAALTLPGTIVGTPQYMAPEQALGQTVDARTDLFAAGLILYEMLAGATPFRHESTVELLHKIIHEQPPPLAGSPVVMAIDPIIRRALAKAPGDRYQQAAEMARALEAAAAVADDSVETTAAHPVARLIVLPFRILRPDPDTDFLAFSLPDAITMSLGGLQSLVIRSSAAAAKYADGTLDLKIVAREAEVDVALTGTLLRAGGQLRVGAQLTELPGGRLLWSESFQVALGDIFQLQDDLTGRIVESLALPLTARERGMLRRDVPASAQAYEYYLRGNQLADDAKGWTIARDLYRQCLEDDSRFAPAWARLARVYRVIGKYRNEEPAENLQRAEAALERALAINPDLPLAHNLYAQLDIDRGRAEEAMRRLLDRANTRGADPEIFSGLVYACRYCGLLAASLAADGQARRLDRNARTSVVHTYFLRREYQRVVEAGFAGAPYIWAIATHELGRTGDAVRIDDAVASLYGVARTPLIVAARALLEGKREESLEAVRRMAASGFRDPEALYYVARHLAHLGDAETALEVLGRSVAGGYYPSPAMAEDPWLDPVRGEPRFREVASEAEERHRQAVATFSEHEGARALGLTEEP